MMKMSLGLILSLCFSNAHAAGGFTWLGGLAHAIHIPEHVVTFTVIAFVLVLFGLIYRSKLAKVSDVVIPDRGLTFRNIVEAYGQFIYDSCKAVLGEADAPKYFKFIASLFIIIFVSNFIGLIPGFLPPTEVLSTTLAFGIVTFVYYNLKGCKELGVVNYLKHFAGPLWYMAILIFPIEILSNMIRPISLGLRLRGNMMGDHMVLSTFQGLSEKILPGVWADIATLIVPLPFYILGLLVCFIQAYVFTMLTMVYISLATAHHDHGEHEHH